MHGSVSCSYIESNFKTNGKGLRTTAWQPIMDHQSATTYSYHAEWMSEGPPADIADSYKQVLSRT